MRKFLSAILLSLLFTQFSCISNAHFKGQILDSQNNPLEGVEVKLVKFTPRQVELTYRLLEVTKTNKNGEFELVVRKIEKKEKLGLVFIKDGFIEEFIGFTPIEVQKHSQAFKDYKIILKKNE